MTKLDEFKNRKKEIVSKINSMENILESVYDSIDSLIIDIEEDRVNYIDELVLRLIDIRDEIME